MKQRQQNFVPYIENSLILNSLISRGLNIMPLPMGIADTPKFIPYIEFSLDQVTISRVDCT